METSPHLLEVSPICPLTNATTTKNAPPSWSTTADSPGRKQNNVPSVPPKYARANPPAIRHAFAKRVARRICIHCQKGVPLRFDEVKHYHLRDRSHLGCAASAVWTTLAQIDADDEYWAAT